MNVIEVQKYLESHTRYIWRPRATKTIAWEFQVYAPDLDRETTVLVPFDSNDKELQKCANQAHKYFQFFLGMKRAKT